MLPLQRKRGLPRVRSPCRFVVLPIYVIPDSLKYLVALFLKRQCDRTLGLPEGLFERLCIMYGCASTTDPAPAPHNVVFQSDFGAKMGLFCAAPALSSTNSVHWLISGGIAWLWIPCGRWLKNLAHFSTESGASCALISIRLGPKSPQIGSDTGYKRT